MSAETQPICSKPDTSVGTGCQRRMRNKEEKDDYVMTELLEKAEHERKTAKLG